MTKKRILIIDDERDFADFLKKNLELLGAFEVYTAYDGEHGIKSARTHRPDLILQDIILPDMYGDEVLERLKSEPLTAKIPVFMISALDDRMVKNIDAIKAKSELYLMKPIQASELKRIIENFFASKSA